MFAYAEFERRVGELQKVITGKLGFSEKNHWGAQERPKRMRKLIRANAKRIRVPPDHVAQIVKVLKQAISPSDLRKSRANLKEGLVAPGNGRVGVKPNPGARHVGGFRHSSSDGNAKAFDGEVGLTKGC